MLRQMFLFVLCICLSLFVPRVDASVCGTADLTVTVRSVNRQCIAEVSLAVQLNDAYTDILQDIVVGGRYTHRQGVFKENLVSPGDRPRFSSALRSYTDVWNVVPYRGFANVDIMYMRAYALNNGQFCVGSIPTLEVFVGTDCASAVYRTSSTLLTSYGDDIVFVIDASGSMAFEHRRLRRFMPKIMRFIAAKSADYRVAIVTYTGQTISTLLSFTANRRAAINAVNSLQAINGEGTEKVYSALRMAMQLPFRPRAYETIILIGDGQPQDPERPSKIKFRNIVNDTNFYVINPDSPPMIHMLQSGEMSSASRIFDTGNIVVPVRNRFALNTMNTGDDTVEPIFSGLARRTGGRYFRSDPRLFPRDLLGLLDDILMSQKYQVCTVGVKEPAVFVRCGTTVNEVWVSNTNTCKVKTQWEDLNTGVVQNPTINPGNTKLYDTVDSIVYLNFRWYDPAANFWGIHTYTFPNC